MEYTRLFFYILSALTFFSLSGFSILSIIEREKRAASVSFTIGVILSVAFLTFSFFPEMARLILAAIFASIFLLLAAGFIYPYGRIERINENPDKRFDERDVMFARAHLKEESEEYRIYYDMHPEKQVVDDETRKLPGLSSPKSKFADPLLFTSPDASFFLTGALRNAVDGPIAGLKIILPEEEMSVYIAALTRYYGALDVGITKLEPYHVYSNIGRGTGKYGDPIKVEHKYAIVFTVEMSYEMIGSNPLAQGLMESAKQYVEAARIAVQLAEAIRLMGYPARAHIDGNYRVIAPLVARDAGLGDIGRMGLLMTPRKGPRVRIGAVTTDLPLITFERKYSASILDFCKICKKCAECCPSRSIPFDDRQEIDGVLRWKINPETCFHYWNTAGTDCGRCMTVCPFSHADNFVHNIVRWGIDHSGLFRRAALQMDDLFYGRKPGLRSVPDWTYTWSKRHNKG